MSFAELVYFGGDYVLKRSIKLSSFLCAVIISLLVFQYISLSQQRVPLGTTNQFDLNISESNISKEELISDLNKITNHNNGVLVKTAVDSEDYENKKDIIWFGSKEPESEGLVIDNKSIHWFDSSLKGDMISASNIGVRPLSGTYSVNGGQIFHDELNKWAANNNVRISWIDNPPVLKHIYAYLFLNGVGNAVLASFLLLLTTITTWFVSHAKSRAIRMLGGVQVSKIHIEDIQKITSMILKGFLIGLFFVLGYVGVAKGVEQIQLVVWNTTIILFIVLLIISCIIALFSIVASPKPEHIAKRKIPLKRFNLLGMINRVAIIILAFIVIPTTVNSAIITHKLSNEHALWEKMQTLVRLSFNDLDSLETETMIPKVESFFKDMYDDNNLQLSIVVNKAIGLSQETMGGYDHIIVTDHAWVDLLGISVNVQGKSGKLVEKEIESLQTALSDFLNGQLPIWTKSKEVQPRGLKFYEYVGTKFLALPPNVGMGGETIQAKNPLVILVENPVEIFKVKGFLLNAASSGNVVFPNEEDLQLALSESPIKPYVASIDSIADVALEMAQKFKQESMYYMAACILILVAMFFAGILSGKLWASTNRKRIFTLHTSGRSYVSIVKPPLRKELFTVVITAIVGSILAYMIHHMQFSILIPVALSIVLLYWLGSLLAYKIYTRKTFYQASHRYY